MLKTVVLTVLLLLSTNNYAETVYLSPQVGLGRTKVDGQYTFDGSNDTSGRIENSATIGLRLLSNVVIEATYVAGSGLSFFGATDSFDLRQSQLLLGYAFPVGNRSYITPKVGVAHWKLEGKEGAFLNPGPERSSSLTGSDTVYAFEWERTVTRFFSLGINSNYISAEFGNAISIRFMSKFNFQ